MLLLAGGCLLLVGLFLGFTAPTSAGQSCGAPFGTSFADELRLSMQRGTVTQDCADARATRTTLTWVLLIPGVVLVAVGGFLALGAAEPLSVKPESARSL